MWGKYLQGLLEAEPFRPFRIVVKGGRGINVLRRDMILLLHDTNSLLFGDRQDDPDRTGVTVPFSLIERVELHEAGPPGLRGGANSSP